MNKTKWFPGLRIGSKYLETAFDFNLQGTEDFIKAITEQYGLVVKMNTNGVYSNDFKVVLFQAALFMSGGYFISNFDELIVEYVDTQVLNFNPSLFGDGTYHVYIVPKKSNYEAGTLTFTQGSKIVTILDSNFDKLQAFDSIKIEDSNLGNNGVYQVSTNINKTNLELTTPFTGTTEQSVKWKILGYFGSNYIVGFDSKLIYEYDSYDIIISKNVINDAFSVADIIISNGGLASIIDTRANNMFALKSISLTNADKVIKGIYKDITTIEEKALAASVTDYFKNLYQQGVFTGFSGVVNGGTLTITSGTCIDGNGRLITVPTLTIDLNALVQSGKIIEGANNVYISYVSPNSYQLTYTQNSIIDPKKILIGLINYSIDSFTYTNITDKSKLVCSSLVLTQKGISSQPGEIYYAPRTPGYGELHYLRAKADGGVEDVILARSMEVESLRVDIEGEISNSQLAIYNLQNRVNSLVNTEKLRFSIFPDIGSPSIRNQGWFTFNEIPAPTIIGTQFIIKSFTIAELPTIAKTDLTVNGSYYGGSCDKEISKSTAVTKIVSMDNLSSMAFVANSLIGVYFNNDETNHRIELWVRDNSAGWQLVGSTTLGYATQLNNMNVFQAEVTVEYFSMNGIGNGQIISQLS